MVLAPISTRDGKTRSDASGYATGVGWLAQNASASCLKPLPAPLRQCSMRGSEATETGCHAMRIRLGARREGRGG